jgi:type I restriction enzyme S subunit
MAGDRLERTTFAKLISDGALEIGDGYRAKNEELGGDGLVFLRAGHVTDTHIDFDGVERFHAELEPRVRSKLAKPGDAVITTKGNSTGRTTFVSSSMPPFVYSPHLSYWRSLDPNRIEGGFLRYWCRGSEFTTQLAGMKASTDMAPYLSLVDQKRLEITLPPVREQRAIGHILGSLDDKIELNRRMNETLESMARALFKSWFVDFLPVRANMEARNRKARTQTGDPVRAKAEGRDPGLPKTLADLFPDSFEDSELGEIPIGWKIGSIYTAAEVIYGAPFSSTKFNSDGVGKPLIRIRDLVDESPGVFTVEEHPKGYLVKPGDIVVGMDGEFRSYLWGGVDSWLNQRVCVFKPRIGFSSSFVLHSIVGLLAGVEATETATTVIHLGKNDIDRFKIVVPAEPILTAFGQLAEPLFHRIVVSKQESRTLVSLRDTLLPKLISGELRVKDAERIVGLV